MDARGYGDTTAHVQSCSSSTSNSTRALQADTKRDSLGNILSPSLTLVSNDADTRPDPQGAKPGPFGMSTAVEKAATIPTCSASRPPSAPSLAVWLCFSALTISIFLVALDTVLLPTALPSISLDFHASDSLYVWTGSAYLLANAASIPFWGTLSDVFGRKLIILVANSTFLAGSILCAVSVSAPMLVAGRAVQGLGGGGVNVLVYVCVADMFIVSDRSFYMGIVGALYAVASALGPVIGGVFAQKLHWRWCFYINLPLVSVAIITLHFTVPLHGPRTPFLQGVKSVDWPGILTILSATICLLVGLQLGGTSSYRNPLVASLIALGTLCFALFPFTQWWATKRGSAPIMPPRLFRNPSNLCALGVCACDALVFNSVAYFLPIYFQLVLCALPSISGIYMLAIALPLALASFMGGWFISKSGRYLEILQAGLALMTVGVGLFITFGATLNLGKLIVFLAVAGFGFGPNFHAPLTALQAQIQATDMAAGTSAFGFVRMVSGALGVVVGQVVFQLLLRPHFSAFVDAGVSAALAEVLAGGQAMSEARRVVLLPEVQRDAVRRGMGGALRGVWIFYTAVSGMSLAVSFGISRRRLDGCGSEAGEAVDMEQG